MSYSKRFHLRRLNKPYYGAMYRGCMATQKYSGIKFRSVCDVGCSCGALLLKFPDEMAKTGIDIMPPELFHPDAGVYIQHDCNEEVLLLPIVFDLVICQEVAEHIENLPKLFMTLKAITNKGGTLVFSGAHRGQRGKHHINCRESWEWIRMLTGYGFRHDSKRTNAYITTCGADIPACYRENTICMTKV